VGAVLTNPIHINHAVYGWSGMHAPSCVDHPVALEREVGIVPPPRRMPGTSMFDQHPAAGVEDQANPPAVVVVCPHPLSIVGSMSPGVCNSRNPQPLKMVGGMGLGANRGYTRLGSDASPPPGTCSGYPIAPPVALEPARALCCTSLPLMRWGSRGFIEMDRAEEAPGYD
jgi:hypothetical protein